MQTLTIRVDNDYLDQILNFLQQIPKNKREIFQHKRLDISNKKIEKPKDDFLTLLANGPTITEKEAQIWENDIKKGYKSWKSFSFQSVLGWNTYESL